MSTPISEALRVLRRKVKAGGYPYRYTLPVYPPGTTEGGYWPSQHVADAAHRYEERQHEYADQLAEYRLEED